MRGTALVTGATGGIGGAVARLLASSGVTVVAVGRSSARLAELASESDLVEPVRCDLEDDDAVQRLGDSVAQRHPGIDMVVLAAGAIRLGDIASLAASDWDAMFDVNVRANARLLGVLGPTLAANRGHVVLIGSLAVTAPRAENAGYAASKAALGVVADAFRASSTGQVRVTTVLPGRTATPMQNYVAEVEGRELQPDQMLDPGDVARAVVDVLAAPTTVDVTEIRMRPSRPAT